MASIAIGRHEAFQIIRDKILYMEMKPGDSISEIALAEELEVSRTPIREAIILLQKEKLIDIYPQRGTFVSLIDLELIQECAFMRHILEVNILNNILEQKIAVMPYVESYLFLQAIAVKKDKPSEYVKNDHLLHSELFALAGHRIVWEALEREYLHTIRYNMIDFRDAFQLKDSLEEHQKIIHFLEIGDKENLKNTLDIHHDPNLRFAEKYKSQYKEYFKK